MVSADDTDPKTMAEMHEPKIISNKEIYGTMAPITENAYHARGGKAEHLPGFARISAGRSVHSLRHGFGRRVVHPSKRDGVIRTTGSATAKLPTGLTSTARCVILAAIHFRRG